MNIRPLALEDHVNQTVISKHHISWCKNNYLPSQHTHIIFLCPFLPRLNTHCETPQLTIQNVLHDWFSLLLVK